jgi:hypothetical protein
MPKIERVHCKGPAPEDSGNSSLVGWDESRNGSTNDRHANSMTLSDNPISNTRAEGLFTGRIGESAVHKRLQSGELFRREQRR